LSERDVSGLLDIKETVAAVEDSFRRQAADRAEASPEAVATFRTVVVDETRQAKVEGRDLVLAARAGAFDWGKAAELKDFVAGRVKPEGRTLFKSVVVALEDVPVASLVYDKAAKSGTYAELPVTLAL
jgi:ornithine cyclodeaminase/alanine dehydrogenase-like protein (mu-crystallin family)